MVNFSKATHYALRALMYLVKNKGRSYIKIKEIAKNEDMPRNFLSKILQVLIKNRIVNSSLGPMGGVKLASDYRRISVADVITAIDGRMNEEGCVLFGYKRCPELVSCPIQNECQNIRRKFHSKLKNITLNKLYNF
ncbi:MAG: Rrf2 family transcriptional regulator [Candidatus Omnitrophota bacterium]